MAKKSKHIKDSIHKKIAYIILNSIPVLIMILLIPFIKNDYILSLLYIIIIAISLVIKYEKKEYLVFIVGFVIMIIFESIFISTGVEIFLRNSLFKIMPLWLPLLWAYSFIAIKRGVKRLDL
jgi:hypothetical protein